MAKKYRGAVSVRAGRLIDESKPSRKQKTHVSAASAVAHEARSVGGKFKVKAHTRVTPSGRTVQVKESTRSVRLHPGMTQTSQHIRRHGLQWGGQTFHNAHDLGKWLQAHGASLHHFQKVHGREVAMAIPHFDRALGHEKVNFVRKHGPIHVTSAAVKKARKRRAIAAHHRAAGYGKPGL